MLTAGMLTVIDARGLPVRQPRDACALDDALREWRALCDARRYFVSLDSLPYTDAYGRHARALLAMGAALDSYSAALAALIEEVTP